MADTSIQWTDKVWNPLRGCTEISPGCAHCYAAVLAARFSGPGQPYEGLARFDARHKAHWSGEVRLAEAKLADPLRWRKPARVFVNSMSDLFHEDVPDAWIDRAFGVMAKAYWHTFQVLTKRADRMADYFSGRSGKDNVISRIIDAAQSHPWPGWAMDDVNRGGGPSGWPYDNIWLGVSVEDRKRADERIPHLLRCPAAVRFLSVEPMLGPIDFRLVPGFNRIGGDLSGFWVIVGGESGHGARPFDLAWARSLRDQCRSAGVAYFLKQLGANCQGYWLDPNAPGDGICHHSPDRGWKLADSHGGDESEWPEDLKGCRAFPRSEVAHV